MIHPPVRCVALSGLVASHRWHKARKKRSKRAGNLKIFTAFYVDPGNRRLRAIPIVKAHPIVTVA